MHARRSRAVVPPRRFKARPWLAVIVLTAALGSCVNFAPKYKPPQPPVPAEWPQGAAYETTTPGARQCPRSDGASPTATGACGLCWRGA
jgi:hypothetical protein